MSPISAQSNLRFGRCCLKNFKMDGGHLGYWNRAIRRLGYWNRTILAILNFHNPRMPPIKFKLNQTYHSRQTSFEDFQDGCHAGHLGYQNRTILMILCLHVAPMPSTKFQLHPTYGSGADNILKIFKMAAVVASMDTILMENLKM